MRAPSVALIFLARGAEKEYLSRFATFLDSYRRYSAGIPHNFYLILKGYKNKYEEETVIRMFSDCNPVVINTSDDKFDLGAYGDAILKVKEDFACFLNSNSEIIARNWLAKLIINLDDPLVGMVGATASYESLKFVNPEFPAFPNPHLRTNAFALRRAHAVELLDSLTVSNKMDAWQLESGRNGLTQRLFAKGLTCLLVGKDGRGYSPEFWPKSEAYRQGAQANLLVQDNVTRMYMQMTASERSTVIMRTWGVSYPASKGLSRL